MAQTTVISEKSLEKILDYLNNYPGAGITEISRGIRKSTSLVSAALRILNNKGLVFKGVQRRTLKSGILSDKLTVGYYIY